MNNVYNMIITLLNSHNISYILKVHQPTPSSKDSARERGESMKIGAKALLLKCKEQYILVVIPADKRVNSRKVRRIVGSSKVRFATQKELEEKTGLPKGAVPPFGDILGTHMIVDKSLFDEEWMAFNAGSLTTSIKMKTLDYKKIVNPNIEEIIQ